MLSEAGTHNVESLKPESLETRSVLWKSVELGEERGSAGVA